MASTRSTAQPRNSGQPNTTPAAVSASRGHCAARGHGARTAARYAAASKPATAARPMATNTAGSCGSAAEPLANRVIGMLSAKMKTPSTPRASPREDEEVSITPL